MSETNSFFQDPPANTERIRQEILADSNLQVSQTPLNGFLGVPETHMARAMSRRAHMTQFLMTVVGNEGEMYAVSELASTELPIDRRHFAVTRIEGEDRRASLVGVWDSTRDFTLRDGLSVVSLGEKLVVSNETNLPTTVTYKKPLKKAEIPTDESTIVLQGVEHSLARERKLGVLEENVHLWAADSRQVKQAAMNLSHSEPVTEATRKHLITAAELSPVEGRFFQ